MPNRTSKSEQPVNLRARALARLSPSRGADDASAALRVIYDLALSPDTAADALALLHELQVYQVELDVQAEELLSARMDVADGLLRQSRLVDGAHSLNFVVDRQTQVLEVNLTGTHDLGVDRDLLLGQKLERFIAPDSVAALHALLERTAAGEIPESAELTLQPLNGVASTVCASATASPDDELFLITFSKMPPLSSETVNA